MDFDAAADRLAGLDLRGIRGADVLTTWDLDDDAVAECRRILVDSGALERTEEMISTGAQAALEALAATPGLTEEGRAALVELVAICTDRQT